MGDMGDVFNLMRKEKQERHTRNFNQNLDLLLSQKPELKFKLKETVCLFREEGKPKVDFYPHTGRWKCGTKLFNGGAKSFLAWYLKQ